MFFVRAYRSLAAIALGLGLFFGLITLSGRPAGMMSGILNFVLILSSAACAALFCAIWLVVRSREQESVSRPYAAGVGVLFALGASVPVIMAPKLGVASTLMVMAISATLSLLLYAGPRLIASAWRKEHSLAFGALGVLLLLSAFVALYALVRP